MEGKSGCRLGWIQSAVNYSLQTDLMKNIANQYIAYWKSGRELGSLRGVIDLETPPYNRF